MRAAISAGLAAVLTLGGGVASVAGQSDSGPDITSQLLFFHRHASGLVLSAVLLALGALAMAPPLYYLYRAVKARKPEIPRVALYAALFGPIAVAVSQIAAQLILLDKAATFAAHGAQTYDEAKRAIDDSALRGAQGLVLAGQLSLGFGFVMVSLNAMRVGLLTRFMGVLGMIVGVLFVIPLGTLQIVQPFWLGALAALFAGRWPNGVPPAWSSGQAEPWPTQQELREARDRAAGKTVAPEPAPAAAAVPAPQARTHPASKKRKRKKRR
ncbi:MAG: hypothetical protein QOD76_1582 [Solirubrobacteraceae bacterium]|nr:hypothetical protein [Solirubrobacteraceae bacterium]